MALARFRSAVTPLRRAVPATVAALSAKTAPALPHNVDGLVAALHPAEPMHCLRPQTLRATARRFVDGFAAATGGRVLYAVKCNPDPAILRQLWKGGVRHFDCASPAEVRVVRQMFGAAATIHYMHPVKNRAAIRAAYNEMDVRDFSLDSAEEVQKILEETSGQDLGLFIRLALPKGKAGLDLSGKFGATHQEAVELLRQCRPLAARLGVCFHVGSQCMDPAAYADALALAGRIIAEAGVTLDVVDVGGGFPVAYPDMTPPDLELYFTAIREGVAALNLSAATEVWCEPGRALVAAGASIVVQVEKRRDGELFINDGAYGSLADAGTLGWRFPCRLIRAGAPQATEAEPALVPFSFWGPTCDSLDRMAGPFMLPSDIREGDYIEIGQLGAYGATLRTAFNGFDRAQMVDVSDAPLMQTAGHPLPSVSELTTVAMSTPSSLINDLPSIAA